MYVDPSGLFLSTDTLGVGKGYPDAKIYGISVTFGCFSVGLDSGMEIVVNSKSGEISIFYYGGFEGGFISYGVDTKYGEVWNLNRNKDYAGPFQSLNFGGNISASIFSSSDKLFSTKFSGSNGISINGGISLFPLKFSASTNEYKQLVTIPLLGYFLNPADALIKYLEKKSNEKNDLKTKILIRSTILLIDTAEKLNGKSIFR